MHLLSKLKDKADIILCIYAGDIERKKIRADFGITYDADALKLIDDLRGWGIDILGVVITRFEGQPAALLFKKKLERRGIRVCTHPIRRAIPPTWSALSATRATGRTSMSSRRSRW